MENKNGQGIFYGVIGVATLVVAIIGATFAYFSASAQSAGDIKGTTLGGSGGVLGLQVSKVDFGDTGATSNDLVPTNISTQALIQSAINNKCVASADGSTGDDVTVYTGCHLYTIHATSQSAVNGATLALTSLTVSDATDDAKWQYALFEGSESSGTYTVSSMINSTPAGFPSSAVNLITSQNLPAGYDHTFYLLV